jgi:hypothetical protein
VLDAFIILHATSAPGGPSRTSAIGGHVGTIPLARFVLGHLRGEPICPDGGRTPGTCGECYDTSDK